MAAGPPQRILTVSQLTALVRDRLESALSDVWVEGEVCNLRAPSSGHLYFGLKDAASQVRAVLFRTSSSRLRFTLRDGLQLVARGRMTVYEPRGEYQLVLEYVEPKGIGALQVAYEQLKERLAKEGLFNQARKRPLPFLPRRVGVVTSPTGAALRDILAILRRRCPLLGVVIAPVPVQGEGAAPLIARAIRQLGASGLVDVLIVGRGGGSFEDLWCFNDEAVVRAIADCPVPVFSAVGHETDVTLADFAADHRAPTPSAAAETVAPVLETIMRTLRDLWLRQEQGMRRRLAAIQQRVQSQYGVLPRLQRQVERQGQRLDDLTERMRRAMDDRLARLRQRVSGSEHRLQMRNPQAVVARGLVLVPQLVKRLEQRMLALLVLHRQAVRSVADSLHGLSPLAILGRGYGIIQGADGRIIRRHRDVTVGEEVRARLSDGELRCEVREIVPDPHA